MQQLQSRAQVKWLNRLPTRRHGPPMRRLEFPKLQCPGHLQGDQCNGPTSQAKGSSKRLATPTSELPPSYPSHPLFLSSLPLSLSPLSLSPSLPPFLSPSLPLPLSPSLPLSLSLSPSLSPSLPRSLACESPAAPTVRLVTCKQQVIASAWLLEVHPLCRPLGHHGLMEQKCCTSSEPPSAAL